MNYGNPQEHVPEAEHNNQVIKEQVWATYHHLPFSHLPCIMIKILVINSAKKLNFFPSKHGISKYYSPWMILHQRNLDYCNMHLFLHPSSQWTRSIGYNCPSHSQLHVATFDIVIMSKKAMICCICKLTAWLPAIDTHPNHSSNY
jgi:hypothetical protein